MFLAHGLLDFTNTCLLERRCVSWLSAGRRSETRACTCRCASDSHCGTPQPILATDPDAVVQYRCSCASMALGKRPAARGLLAARLKAAKTARNLPVQTGNADKGAGISRAAPSRMADDSDSGDEEALIEVLSIVPE